MEERKKVEIEYYDEKAEEWLEKGTGRKTITDFEGFKPSLLSSFRICDEYLKDKCQNKKVLDYGCGNGVHSIFPAKCGAEVMGIDLSEPSLKIARERAKQEGVGNKVQFLVMDCEKMEFPDNLFDIIFDGGTFSSIDLKKAYPELARVLKPNGFLIGIETFGHNPFTNLKRKINKVLGKRTEWAAEHIFKMDDLELAKGYFNKIEVHFFHLISWIIFPFLGLPGSKTLLKLLEGVDRILFKIPFLRKYAFKVVFIFGEPKSRRGNLFLTSSEDSAND